MPSTVHSPTSLPPAHFEAALHVALPFWKLMTARQLLREHRAAETRGAAPTLRQVATRLHLSTRTLARRLRDEQSSFQLLLERERRERALRWVEGEHGSAVIADRLGYSSVANFERAFRRWTGQSPRQYRSARRD